MVDVNDVRSNLQVHLVGYSRQRVWSLFNVDRSHGDSDTCHFHLLNQGLGMGLGLGLQNTNLINCSIHAVFKSFSLDTFPVLQKCALIVFAADRTPLWSLDYSSHSGNIAGFN